MGLPFKCGEIFISDSGSSKIRKIGWGPNMTTFAGTGEFKDFGEVGPATQAQLKSPYRMVFDKEGNLYFSDRDNNRIRKIDPQGIISTVAGNSNIGWLQDGLEVRITVHNFP
jgi:hypothetical protein